MSRPTSISRSLTATEELERLEQSITLTLQEIDENFSKAHRIVTTSILPVVEQYGEHSRAVWEASKFWKQFFEASANVSLSGYEELAGDGETTVEESTVRDESSAMEESTSRDDMTSTSNGRSRGYHGEESMLDDDGDLTGSTPRPPATKTVKTQFANLQSPYELMRQEMKGEEDEGQTTVLEDDDDEDDDNFNDDEAENSTAQFEQRTARILDLSMTPGQLTSRQHDNTTEHGKDPLLHRVLDKNYRIKSTPHKNAPPMAATKHAAWQDSPMSSPEMTVPKLRSAAFMSPTKGGRGGAAAARARLQAAVSEPRTPGVSVQTPATARKTRDALAGDGGGGGDVKGKNTTKYEIDWESDSDDGGPSGMSPPKTINFALPPSKLLQTPAREASKRIVEDILLTAGDIANQDEYSPTMVKMNENILDDSF